MADIRITATQAGAATEVDLPRVDQTTEEDIRRFNVEDGFDPDNTLAGLRQLRSPAEIRTRLNMSDERFAAALRIPLATLRDWENGRLKPDAAAQSLFALVDADHEHVFRVLAA